VVVSRGPLVPALVAALVAALAACGGGNDGNEPVSLEGTAWVLTDGVTVPQGVAVTVPTAAFTATEVAGTTGCNRYGGGYAIEGDTLEFRAIAQTTAACPAPAGAVEREFVDALGRVEMWELDGDDLVLGDSDGTELLRFEPAPQS